MKAQRRTSAGSVSHVKNAVSSASSGATQAKPIKNALGVKPKSLGTKIRGSVMS